MRFLTIHEIRDTWQKIEILFVFEKNKYFFLFFSVGFQDVQGLDKTDDFYRILGEELVKFEPTKEEFIKVKHNLKKNYSMKLIETQSSVNR